MISQLLYLSERTVQSIRVLHLCFKVIHKKPNIRFLPESEAKKKKKEISCCSSLKSGL